MCEMNLRNQAMSVAIFDIIGSIIKFACIFVLWSHLELEFGLYFYACLGFIMVELAIANMLFVGIEEEKMVYCIIWWCYNFILYILSIIIAIVTTYLQRDILNLIIHCISITIYTFMLKIVHSYWKEVKADRRDVEQSVGFSPSPAVV